MKDRLQELQNASRKLTRKMSHQTNLFMETMNEKSQQIDLFMAQCQQVTSDLDSLEQQVHWVDLQHANLLSSPTFDPKTKEMLESRHQEVTRLVSHLKVKIEQTTSWMTSQVTYSPTILRIVQTQANLQQWRLIDLMTTYNRNQVTSREKQKNKLKRQLEIIGQSSKWDDLKVMTDQQLEEMIEKGDVAIFTQDIDTRTERNRKILADVESRHAQIVQLEQSIKQLQDIFLDMALLVEEQGHRVNSIENHVRLARDQFNHGIQVALKAVPLQQRSQRRKYCAMAIALFILLVIVLLLSISFIR